MNYESYLDLKSILSAQHLESEKKGRKAHDEMLFVVIHQTYELWFKQILYELDSILDIFAKPTVDEKNIGTVVARLVRINKIMDVLVQQVDVLETMTPMDFLDFRDLIYSASGFQSFQFRVLENKLGLRSTDRISYNSQPYYSSVSPDRVTEVRESEKSLSLFEGLESWLSRTPFLEIKGFSFWQKYKESVNIMFQQDEDFLASQTSLSDSDRSTLQRNINMSRDSFAALFDENIYNQQRNQGEWRLQYKAIHAALLIQLYREQSAFQLPFRLITEVLTLDSHLTQWRYRHTIMVKRMLGSRIGTGGSTGAKYLKESADKHKIFEDFYKLTTFFIPSSKLPKLPAEIGQMLGFQFEGGN